MPMIFNLVALQLTSVELPEGLERIGQGEFQRCTSLHEIVAARHLEIENHRTN